MPTKIHDHIVNNLCHSILAVEAVNMSQGVVYVLVDTETLRELIAVYKRTVRRNNIANEEEGHTA